VRVNSILKDEKYLFAAATYADEARLLRPDTARWHFVDIPKDASSYVAKRDCVDDNCLVAAVERFQRYLIYSTRETKGGASDSDVEALKFFIHLVGDLGQPFHCYDGGDQGGNAIPVRFSGRLTSLHAVWDTYLLESLMSPSKSQPKDLAELFFGKGKGKGILGPISLSEEDYAKQLIVMLGDPALLAAKFPGQSRADWVKGGPEDWATDSHLIAVAALNLSEAPAPAQKTAKPLPPKAPPLKKKAADAGAVWSHEAAFAFARPAAWRAPERPLIPDVPGWYYSANSLIVEQQLLKSGLRLALLLNEALDPQKR
jgi:hypothetical protein